MAFPLHDNQHAYLTGRSCDSGLHHLVCKIEKALVDKEIALAILLDIKGAYDNTHTSVIQDSVREHGIDGLTCGSISEMLRRRIVSFSQVSDSITLTTSRGRPLWGKFSPFFFGSLLWANSSGLPMANMYTLSYIRTIW